VNEEEAHALISNEFELTLPLDIQKITLPKMSQRKLDKDYYDEYMEIIEYINPIRKLERLRKSKDFIS
jgi:hypothetical protein